MDISLGIILDRLSEYRIETYLPHPSELKFDRIELFPQRIADLTGVRLDDPTEEAYLRLSMWLKFGLL